MVGGWGGGRKKCLPSTSTCNCSGTAPGIMLLAVEYSLGMCLS